MTDRLQKCIDAGSVEALFPLLKDWPEEELRALLDDIDAHYEQYNQKIDEAYQEHVFKPENFFNKTRSKTLDKVRDEYKMTILIMCSEISSVALYYLGNEA